MGDFCGFLFEEMRSREPNVILPEIFTRTTQQHISEFVLLSAVNFSNTDLVYLIYFVFNEKFPSPKQLLRCDKQMTLEELDIFFQRMTFFHKNRYLILGINTLTHELQQVNSIIYCK